MVNKKNSIIEKNLKLINKKIMTKEKKEQLIKRLKGFAWGLASACGIAGALAGLSYITTMVPTLGLPEFLVMTVILLSEQITKYLNTK